MNAKVTTWWKNGREPVVRNMKETEVERYLANLPKDQLKGYIVDASPEGETNKRPRNDIAVGDPVRLEHSLGYGTVKAEEGPGPEDKITVLMLDGHELTGPRRRFVPLWTRDF